jgi:purine catabolism regulator
MGIPLREVMKIYPFSQNRLIAGAAGLDRIVVSSNIQEVPEVDKWLRGGEILFSAGYAMADITDKKGFLKKLNESGLAAMVLKPGPYLPFIPDDVIEYCDEIGLPLFQMPENLPYMSCILPIFERITNQQLWVLQKIERVHEDILKNIINGGGLDSICQTLFNVSGNKTAIYSVNGRVMATSYDASIETESEMTQDLDAELLRFLTTIGSEQWLLCPHQKILFREQYWICVPVQARGEILAYLFQCCSSKDDDATNSILLSQTSMLIALEIIQEQSLVEREHQIAEQLLEDVLLRRYKDERVIHMRGLYLQLDFRNPYFIFAVNADSFENYLSLNEQETDELEVQQIKNMIRKITRTTLSEHCNAFLLMNEGVGMIGMIEVNSRCCENTVFKALEVLLERLGDELSKLKFSVGISRRTSGLANAEKALEEAQKAILVSRRRRDDIKLSCFSDLGSLVFLSELSDSESLKSFCDKKLGTLQEYDSQNNGSLLQTLAAYLECDGHLQRTADFLFVHKNSVIYRLNKIRGLIDVDLSDYRTLFDLHLCMLMRDFI